MKNLFLTAALMLSIATFAQTPEQNTNTTTAPAQTTQTAPQQAVTPQTQPAATATDATATASTDEGFKKIAQSEIAIDVLRPAVKKYEGFSLVEAMVAEDGSQYKLVLTKDGKDVAAYFKSNGEFIKEETV